MASDLKRYRLNKMIKDQGVDILCLQETHKSKRDVRPLMKSSDWSLQIESRGTNKARGVAILLHSRMNIDVLEQCKDRDGRFIFVKFRMNGKKYTLACIYAPNKGQTLFLNRTFQRLQSFYEGDLLIAGDLNNDIRENKKLNLKKWKLKEVFSLLQDEKHPTFFSKRYKKFSCIDHILVKETNDMEVNRVETGAIWISDHAPLLVEIGLEEEQKVRRWRFNSRIFLQQKDREDLIRGIQKYFKENKGSAEEDIIWDAAKAVIRGICISKEIHFRRKVNFKREQKLKEIVELQRRLQVKFERQIQEQLNRVKEELQELDNLFLWKKDLLVRNEYQRININSMKRLANYLKKRKEKQKIGCMKNETGSKVFKDKQIREIFEDFYSKLFKVNEEKQFEEAIVNKIKKQDLAILNEEITQQEILTVIKNLKSRKSPGLDGFTSEFYKMVGPLIVPEMQSLFNKIMKGGRAPESWRKTEIMIILKQSRDPTDPNSYRPISLTNQDYKIFAKILANRLEKTLPRLIGEDQYGFVKGRYIGHPIRNVINTLHHGNSEGRFALLKLDVYKAFDTLSHGYLFQVLSKFGFDGPFLIALKEIYREGKAMIKVNDNYTKEILLQRGVKQGCPLSPMLFVLSMEPLAEKIRSSSKIRGYTVGKEVIKLNLYADDIILVLQNPLDAIRELLIILEEFKEYSGLGVNISKSEIMFKRIDLKEQKEIAKLTGMKLGIRRLKYLGITITKSIKNLMGTNYKITWRRIQEKLNEWDNRYISILGKIRAIKMFIIPKMLYLFQVLPEYIPKKQLAVWDQELKNWVFGKKKARIVKRVIYSPQEDLGWGLPHLESYYEAFQIKMLLELDGKSVEKWVRWEDIINKGVGKFGIFTQKVKNDIKNTIGPRQTALTIWGERQLNWMPSLSKWTPLESLGEDLKIEKTFWKKLKETGYYRVKDLYNPQGIQIPAQNVVGQVGRQYWLQTMALYNILKQRRYSGILNKEDTPLEKLYNNKEDNKKGIARKLYNLINTDKDYMIGTIQTKWEREMTLSAYEIDGLMEGILEIKMDKFRELEMKLILKWYRTPPQLSYMIKGLNSSCWHCKRSKGYYAHLWCECPKVIEFWQLILEKVNAVCNIKLQLTGKILFMGVLGNNKVKKPKQNLFKAMIIAAHAVIAYGWKDASKWTLERWNWYLYEWIQSDILSILTQDKVWEEKTLEIRKKWSGYVRWVREGGANNVILVKLQKVCSWLQI